MQFKSKQKREYWFVSTLGLIPEFLIAAAIAAVTESGFIGLIVAFFALQTLYLFIWIKNSLWAWAIFLWRGRRTVADTVCEFLQNNKFPDPATYLESADDYFESVARDEANPIDLRIRAAVELGALKTLSVFGYIQHAVRVGMAYEDGIARYQTICGTAKSPQSLEKSVMEEQDSSNEEEENKKVQLVQLKCKYAEAFIAGIDGSGSEIDVREKAALEKFLKTCLSHTEEIKDEFYRSAALHHVADLLSKAGQFERAREIIAGITVDFIQEKASDFLMQEEGKRAQLEK